VVPVLLRRDRDRPARGGEFVEFDEFVELIEHVQQRVDRRQYPRRQVRPDGPVE
jgi:hypothetical protein